jgi:FMN-dependent NADH-azoreductase|tara:strand:+ start:307 stop:480 length:174 start_codon:yes stop_codon:yes gene_type:complete
MKDEYDGQDPETSSADDATIEDIEELSKELSKGDSIAIQYSMFNLGYMPSMISEVII